MPNIDDIYPSKWMRAADLRGSSHQVAIQDVDTGTIGEKQQLILEFRGAWKPLGLNKTNAQAIADVFGSDTDDWIGQEVVIFPTRVDFQGKMVDAIRVDGKATQKLVQERLKQASKPVAKAGVRSAKIEASDHPHSRPTAPALTQAEADAAGEDDIPF
jgi:hypothetical protein